MYSFLLKTFLLNFLKASFPLLIWRAFFAVITNFLSSVTKQKLKITAYFFFIWDRCDFLIDSVKQSISASDIMRITSPLFYTVYHTGTHKQGVTFHLAEIRPKEPNSVSSNSSILIQNITSVRYFSSITIFVFHAWKELLRFWKEKMYPKLELKGLHKQIWTWIGCLEDHSQFCSVKMLLQFKACYWFLKMPFDVILSCCKTFATYNDVRGQLATNGNSLLHQHYHQKDCWRQMAFFLQLYSIRDLTKDRIPTNVTVMRRTLLYWL